MGDIGNLLSSPITLLVVMVVGFYWLGRKLDKK